MPVSSVGNSGSVSNQAIQQSQGSQPTTGRPHGHWRRGGDHESGDHFSQSGSQRAEQSSGDTGTYSVSQVDIFSIAARFILAQSGAASAAPSTAASTADSAASAPASSASTPASDVSSTPASSVPLPVVDSASGSTAVAAETPSASTAAGSQDPLQALNTALTSLGLSQQEIQAFDQVATLINAFSPTAFSDLVSQLQQLAQQLAQPASATPSSQPATDGTAASTDPTSDTTASAPTNSVTPSNTNSSGTTFQIEELTIRFSGIEAQGTTTNAANGTSGSQAASNVTSFQASAFNLQIQEVNLTLTDENGQVAQIQAPQQPANTDSSAATQPATSSSAASA